MSEVGHVITGQPEEEGACAVVLQVLPSLVTGGVERSAVDIAQAVVQAGGTAIVASEGGLMEVELQRAGARHVKLPLASKNPFVIRANVRRLTQLIEEQQVDLVHARSRAPAWSAYYAAKRTGRPFVTTFHGTYNFRSGLKKRYNAIMLRGELVIANSDFIAKHIRENYKVDPERIRVVHRGIDLVKFSPRNISVERVVALATRWRLPDGVPIIMLPGRLTRWKGQTILIEALTHLSDIEFVAIMVGSDQGRTDYRRELEAAIEKRGLAGKAVVLDECDDMAAAYKLADVVVSASTDPEAFGRVVSEGQALGRPVVAADHGGAPEQILPGHTGWLFPPGDPKGLAAGLRWALGLNNAARAALALQAEIHVRQHFSKQQMCQKTLAIYDEVLRERGYERAPFPRLQREA